MLVLVILSFAHFVQGAHLTRLSSWPTKDLAWKTIEKAAAAIPGRLAATTNFLTEKAGRKLGLAWRFIDTSKIVETASKAAPVFLDAISSDSVQEFVLGVRPTNFFLGPFQPLR